MFPSFERNRMCSRMFAKSVTGRKRAAFLRRTLHAEEAEPGREGAVAGRPGEDVPRLPDHPPKEARDAETKT